MTPGVARASSSALRTRPFQPAPALVALLAAASSLAATWPDDTLTALPCRPTIACTADIVRPGAFELELGYLYRRLAGPANQHTVPFVAKLSLTDWLQLQVGSNGATFVDRPAASYFDDVQAGLKLHLLDQSAWAPSLSLSAQLSVPTAPETGYLRTWDALFIAYVTKDFGKLHADLNLGFNLWRLDQVAPQPWAALALSVSLPRDFTVMAEGYYFGDAAPVSSRDSGVLAALAYAAKPWLVFDAGGDVGFISRTRAFSLFVGMTVVMVDFWETDAESRARVRTAH